MIDDINIMLPLVTILRVQDCTEDFTPMFPVEHSQQITFTELVCKNGLQISDV